MANGFFDILLRQLIALLTFFAFPALRYVSLKWFTRKHGNPELWYLPKYGFRLVIRNLPTRKTLSEIKYRVLLRRIVPASTGSSVATLEDTVVHQRDDFFLFAGSDQILASFKLERTSSGYAGLIFVLTDKLGKEHDKISLDDFERLICDYVANVKNYFNFDIKVERRVEIKSDSLRALWSSIQQDSSERNFSLDRIRDATTGRDLKGTGEGPAAELLRHGKMFHQLALRLKGSLRDWLAFAIAIGLVSLSQLAISHTSVFTVQTIKVLLIERLHDWVIVGLLVALGVRLVSRLIQADALPRRLGRYIFLFTGVVIASSYGVLFSDLLVHLVWRVLIIGGVVIAVLLGSLWIGGWIISLIARRNEPFQNPKGEVGRGRSTL